MVRVNFISEGVIAEVEKGTTILQAARSAGVLIESPCNSAGICGKCKVKLNPGDLQFILNQGKHHHLTGKEVSEGYVLACQAEAVGDIEVVSVVKNQNKTLKILSDGQSFAIKLNSYIKKYYDGKSATLVMGGGDVLGKESGNTEELNFGVVVDIGTTTLVSSLVDIASGREIASVSSLNPQSLLAQDVLSRIKYASDKQGLQTMFTDILKEINRMIREISKEAGVNRKNIYEVVFSGNTTMIHLAANVNPYSLGKYPYTPELRGGCHKSSAELGVEIADFGLVYFPPIISSYVGPDITSGVLASRLHDQKGVTLFVDIGTNGEMVLSSDGLLTATSTAAGPAFEGMNITCGMRAALGAIEYFEINEDAGIEVRTIGGAKAAGICGSGLLDIVGELVDHGIVSKNGKFVSPDDNSLPGTLRSRLTKLDGKPAFVVAEGILITQKDIRQVQLAKGAVRSGIEFLLTSNGVTADAVDKVLIAGSFGFHLRAKSLINIGLLLKEFESKVEFVGNTSKAGGKAFLLNGLYRLEMQNLVRKIKVIELSNHIDFDKIFVASLAF